MINKEVKKWCGLEGQKEKIKIKMRMLKQKDFKLAIQSEMENKVSHP